MPASDDKELKNRLNDIFATDDELVYLKSNFEKNLKINAQVDNLIVYQNVWTKEDEATAIQKIGAADFTKVLITSLAEFYRFESIEEKLPQQFMSTKYYTIDPVVKQAMEDLCYEVYVPKHKRHILKQAVWKITREK